MKMLVCAAVTLIIAFGVTTARAERVWDGYIHLVDSHLKLHFGDYDVGSVDHLRHLTIDTKGRGKLGVADLAIAPDTDNPLQATFVGKILIRVDATKVSTDKLRLVRKTQYSTTWRIHPEDVVTIQAKSSGHSNANSESHENAQKEIRNDLRLGAP